MVRLAIIAPAGYPQTATSVDGSVIVVGGSTLGQRLGHDVATKSTSIVTLNTPGSVVPKKALIDLMRVRLFNRQEPNIPLLQQKSSHFHMMGLLRPRGILLPTSAPSEVRRALLMPSTIQAK